MPTGYTAKLCEGEQTFEEFVWTCARAMGALVMMREDPLDKLPPKRFEPSTFYAERIAEEECALRELRDMTPEEADRRADEEFRQRETAFLEEREKVSNLRRRLDAMLARVEQWTPPSSEHGGLRGFMLEQLNETIKWDGRTCLELPKRERGDEWRRRRIVSLEEMLASAQKDDAAERKRVEDRNRWMDALEASVPRLKP